MCRVVVADDEEVVLDGLVLALDSAPDIQVVGRAASGGQALSLAVMLSPDVLVVDLRMRDLGGLALARRLRDAGRCAPRILAVTSCADRALLVEAWALGVRGLLLKTSAASDLLYAVRKVAAGGAVVDSQLVTDVLDHLARFRDPATMAFERRWQQLTERERRAVIGVSQGLTNLAIAQRLGVAEGTVKSHVSRALGKLQLRNRAHVAAVFNRVRQVRGPWEPGVRGSDQGGGSADLPVSSWTEFMTSGMARQEMRPPRSYGTSRRAGRGATRAPRPLRDQWSHDVNDRGALPRHPASGLPVARFGHRAPGRAMPTGTSRPSRSRRLPGSGKSRPASSARARSCRSGACPAFAGVGP